MSEIVTLTLNPTIDKSVSVDRVVAEHKLRCSAPRFEPGGGGINVTRAVNKLGGTARALWTRGGATGELLEQLLDAEDIDHYPLPVAGLTRENLIVDETVSDQQYRFGMPGEALRDEELQDCLTRLGRLDPVPDYLVLSGSLPPGAPIDTYARIARAVPEGSRVILDTSGEALRQSLQERLFLIKPNLRELGQLAGRELEDDTDIREVARGLIGEDRVTVVVTSLGAGGVTVTTADAHHHVRAPTVPIRSKVGAGDSTVAGIVLALARGKTILEAVRFGVAAGAAAVMSAGTELCGRDDTERLYGQISEETA